MGYLVAKGFSRRINPNLEMAWGESGDVPDRFSREIPYPIIVVYNRMRD